ncbi:MAG: hypothetical protein LPK01_02565 [Hymenobacteraceae bacterium]|nr:hypothetical protein [Hymenobacteraceae bacterium]
MESVKSIFSRRKFTLFGLGVLSSITVFRFFTSSDNEAESGKKKTVKMLAQDGTLVEVDATMLASGKRKVSDDELLTWIRK